MTMPWVGGLLLAATAGVAMASLVGRQAKADPPPSRPALVPRSLTLVPPPAAVNATSPAKKLIIAAGSGAQRYEGTIDARAGVSLLSASGIGVLVLTAHNGQQEVSCQFTGLSVGDAAALVRQVDDPTTLAVGCWGTAWTSDVASLKSVTVGTNPNDGDITIFTGQ